MPGSPEMITLFENDTIVVKAPVFFTPNADGWDDIYTLSAYHKLNNTEVINSGTIEINDNCDQLYYSENINTFFWDGVSADEGRYYLKLYIELIDNNIIDTTIIIELHR